MYNEADDRTTLGIVEGETRTYHGITGELVETETLQGTDAITQITTMVGRFIGHGLVSAPFTEIRSITKQHFEIESDINRFMSVSLVVK